MSAVKLNTASGGSISLTPQDTASDVVVTVPAGTSTMVTNATLPTQLNASGSAPIYACRAWVNFNGTGTVAIRASGNVSSITDVGAGLYIVNFTNAMPDSNFAATAGFNIPSWQAWVINFVTPTTTSIYLQIGYGTAPTHADFSTVYVAIFR